MSEWILILTIVAGTYSAPAITSVGEFESRELCMRAGTLWLAQKDKYADSKKAVCVQRSVGKGESRG